MTSLSENMADQSLNGPNHDVLRFHRFLNDNRLPGIQFGKNDSTGCVDFRKCKFVPLSALELYFQNHDTLRSLLQSIYGEDEPNVDAETVYSDYLRVFCILILIKRGRWIEYFLDNDIPDRSLPLKSPPAEFKNVDPTFWRDFNEQQWQFYPHKFNLNHISITTADSLVFPIASYTSIDEGDGRSITKVKLHGGYHNLRPTSDGATEEQEEKRNTFIFKSLNGSDSKHVECFESEVRAFRKLGCNGLGNANKLPPSEIIRFFGSFKNNGIYHIVLEYADLGTLQEYLKQTPPPQNENDLMDFWKSMIAIAKGIALIHRLLPENQNQTIGVFQGYHQDVKWTNILVFNDESHSPYRVKFKIADLGLSNFVKSHHYVSNASGRGRTGTRTFGSPESYQAHHFSSGHFITGQASDIWSLACIYSIAATWAIRGWDLVQLYSIDRQSARESSKRLKSDCFHDDENVLDQVQIWHTFLDNTKMHFDHITPQIWSKLLQKGFAPVAKRCNAIEFQFAAIELLTVPRTVAINRARTDSFISSTPFDVDRSSSRCSHIDTQPHNAWSRYENPLVQSLDKSTNQEYSLFGPSAQNSVYNVRDSSVHHDVDNHTSHSLDQRENIVARSPPSHSHRFSASSTEQSHRIDSNSSPSHTRSTLSSFGKISGDIHGPDLSNRNVSSVNGFEHPRQGDRGVVEPTPKMVVEDQVRPTVDSGHGYKCPLHPNNKKPMDSMTRDDLHKWRRAQYEGGGFEVPHSALTSGLKDRDYVFLFEDSESMKLHWHDVCDLFWDMAKFLKEYDKDGVEIFSTVGKIRKKDSKTTLLVEMVRSMKSRLNSSSQPTEALSNIWNKYKDGIRKGKRTRYFGRKQKVGLLIYVFTDGVWQEGADAKMRKLLKEIIGFLKANNCEEKSVGIQFIQFGEGEAETQRLEALDKDVGTDFGLDIVDRESANGNVWKIFLGAINDYFDDDHREQCNCRGKDVSSSTP